MKIITWNVRSKNARLPRLLAAALTEKPDILCLQEVPRKKLPLVEAIAGYRVVSTVDIKGKTRDKDIMTCIVSAIPIAKTETVTFTPPVKPSLWEKLVYRAVNAFSETYSALVVDLSVDTQPIRIISTRLSMAIRTTDRLFHASRLLSLATSRTPTVICGDFNIVDSRLVNLLSGWARGFRLPDYLVSERKRFETMVKRYHMVNIFRGSPTWATRYPALQFDHIIVPNTMTVKTHFVAKKRYGSDHRMLCADIALPSSL